MLRSFRRISGNGRRASITQRHNDGSKLRVDKQSRKSARSKHWRPTLEPMAPYEPNPFCHCCRRFMRIRACGASHLDNDNHRHPNVAAGVSERDCHCVHGHDKKPRPQRPRGLPLAIGSGETDASNRAAVLKPRVWSLDLRPHAPKTSRPPPPNSILWPQARRRVSPCPASIWWPLLPRVYATVLPPLGVRIVKLCGRDGLPHWWGRLMEGATGGIQMGRNRTPDGKIAERWSGPGDTVRMTNMPDVDKCATWQDFQ